MLKNWKSQNSLASSTSPDLLDDILFSYGNDRDIVSLLRSTLLAADAELDDVIVGTSKHPGVAANSLIMSNITASGDLLFLVNNGGNSLAAFWADGSTGDTALLAKSGQSVDMYIGGAKVFDLANDGTKTTLMGLAGDYWRIGDAGTTGYGLNSEDDLMVTGEFEVKGISYYDGIAQFNATIRMIDDGKLNFGTSADAGFLYETADADARIVIGYIDESTDSGDNVPVFLWGEHTAVLDKDFGLFDEVVQPHIATITNDGVVKSSSSATSDDGGATVEFLDTGVGTAAEVGDVLRVTAGTNATVGWYWITTVVGADEVDLDRNWCTGNVSGGTYKIFRGLGMITPRAIYLPIYDGAPQDSDIDIDMAGAMALDVGQANGRLYWRIGAAWHYVDATAGLSLPADERIDANGHEFQIGDTVGLVVDRINGDGSFHAMPVRSN